MSTSIRKVRHAHSQHAYVTNLTAGVNVIFDYVRTSK
jgi:hypothetical protein